MGEPARITAPRALPFFPFRSGLIYSSEYLPPDLDLELEPLPRRQRLHANLDVAYLP